MVISEYPPIVLAACDSHARDVRLHAICFAEDSNSSGPLILIARDQAEADATDAALRARGDDVPACWRWVETRRLQEVNLPLVVWKCDKAPAG